MTNTPSLNITNASTPSLFRIFSAMFYDLWLIIAIIMLGATLDTFIRMGLGLDSGEGNQFILQAYFFLAPLGFYVWFWTHGGQSLGMKSWKLILVNEEGEPVSARQAAVRFIVATISLVACGLGYFWRLINKEKLMWHDMASRTRLVIIEKEK